MAFATQHEGLICITTSLSHRHMEREIKCVQPGFYQSVIMHSFVHNVIEISAPE